MGEERRTYHWGAEPQTTQRLTVAQAAEALGITEGAVRSRIKRGTLENRKESGTVYVLLGGGTSEANQATKTGVPAGSQSELVDELRGQVRFLREELARKDAILLNMTEAMKALSPPAQEAPPEASEPPSEATEQPGRVEPQPAVGGAQEPRESHEMHMPSAGGGPRARDQQAPSERPWWRRMFGG